MKTIYLVRHGHIDNPKDIFYDSDFPLSPVGAKEMLGIAEDMKKAGCAPAFIISSPYLRTRESAEIIAQAFGTQEVEFDKQLIDWQVGDWIGKPLEDFRQFVGYYHEPFAPNFEGIETYSEMADRALKVINGLKEKLDEEACGIIVGHREPLASALLRLLDKPDAEMREISLPKGSAWKLTYENDKLLSADKSFARSSAESKNSV